MNRRFRYLKPVAALCLLLLFLLPPNPVDARSDPPVDDAEEAMLRATRFMVETVSTHGGYLRLYTSDFSRRWSELEAFESQIMLTYGRTPAMGHLFLNAYETTGEEYYYDAAEKVARALIWGQHDVGGWDYLIDFAGDRSLRRWHETIGRNAWGWNEYNHYYAAPTFKNGTTVEAARFLLRIYLKKLDPAIKPALEKAIDYFLESQFPIGSWPQRYPVKHHFQHQGQSEYVYFHVLNDDLSWENIEFLIQCYLTLGEERVLNPIMRGMNAYLITQQGQGGWAQQYNMNLEPAHGRPYEPAALLPRKTYRHIQLLMQFYRYTGDRKFLARIPDAIDWLEHVRLPEEMTEEGRYTHPVFVEPGSNRPLFAHRRGDGVVNGIYWIDYNDDLPLLHYGAKSNLDLDQLRREYEEIVASASESGRSGSGVTFPEQFRNPSMSFPDRIPDGEEVSSILTSLDPDGRWLTTGEWISRPYRIDENGRETNTALMSSEAGAQIRDSSDQRYISTDRFMRNMTLLLNYIEAYGE